MVSYIIPRFLAGEADGPVREFVPNVIEPSFGLGRILYSLLEHSYWAREQDKARGVLSFPPIVAPIKCLIVTISQDPKLRNIIHDICKLLG